MSFFSNIGENISNFFENKNQSAYVNQQTDILNQQIEDNHTQVKYILFGGLAAIFVIGFLLILQRR